MANIQFKSDNQNQSVLFPSRLDENIPAIHPVRIVNEIVDKLDIRDLLSEYKGGGTSAYHPRMLLKILIYGYLNNLYSSRRIAQQLTENIHFMWLSGRQTPDFRTINDFRSKRLKGRINALFTSVVQLMAEEGFVSLTTQYIDGTKLESASNRYTFVWRRSVETHKSRLEEKIRKVFDLIEQAITEDNTSALESELSGMSSTELRERLARLTSRLPQPSAPVKKACRELETKLLPKLQEYEEKLDICGERNSYSKTDHDATFMRMKEDHMKNGQLKPAYNVQISTENQIITHFGIYQRPGDTALLIPYLESFKQRYGLNDLCGHTVVADSGYGSEQNYEYMEQGGITAYVKYNYFHKEQKKAYVNNPFLPQNLVYNPDGDFIICPSGQKMNFTGTKNNISDLGYQSQSSLYQAENCQDCPLRTQCHKAKGNRVIELNHKLLAYRRRAKELLMSEEGLRHRSKRPVEVEAVFGQLKKNRMFNRFRMRGIKKVEIEFGLLAMAHNLLKMIKNRVKSCFLCIYTKNWNTFEENQTRKSSIKKKRERREKNTKKKTDRIFYFSVSLFIPAVEFSIIIDKSCFYSARIVISAPEAKS
jgi:transposase